MAAKKQYEGSGSDFIRSQSLDLTTGAVIQAGEKVGLKLTAGLVRIVRWKMRKSSGAVTPRKRGRKPGPKPAATKRGRKPTGKRRGPPKATPLVADLPFDHVGSRLPPPELESSAREADTFCRIVTKIGTTKARALLDELEK